MLVLGLAGAAAAAAAAADMASLVTEFATARGQFEAGRAGSTGATDRAQRLFAQLLRRDADNPLYLAYYGSTFTLQARDTRIPWTRIKLIKHGTALLDRALGLLELPSAAARPAAAHPAAGAAALETRLVAIATFIALPEPLFHRRAAARREYQLAVSSPDYSLASPDLRGHLEYEGALIAREEGDAATEKTALRRVLALSPPSIDLAEVHARLAELH
ncbi:MAG: hypothetical protein KGL25_01615 [Gammaproteobacteria bacterium]|nr:hypothetical protein [Gammaproteobacteria bacterium]